VTRFLQLLDDYLASKQLQVKHAAFLAVFAIFM
jgi:hypothetical protein